MNFDLPLFNYKILRWNILLWQINTLPFISLENYTIDDIQHLDNLYV